MNNLAAWISIIAGIVIILTFLTGLLASIASIFGAHPLRWLRVRTIDRVKAWVESQHDDIEMLKYQATNSGNLLVEVILTSNQMAERVLEHTNRLSELSNRVADLEILTRQNETTELKAALTEQTKHLDDTVGAVDGLIGQVAQVESNLAMFRQWVDQMLIQTGKDSEKFYVPMTEVMRRIEWAEAEIKELHTRILNLKIDTDTVSDEQPEAEDRAHKQS